MSESTELRTDCLVVGLFSGNKLTRSATAIDRATGGLLKRLIQQGDLEGSLGQTLLVPGGNTLPALRFLVVGRRPVRNAIGVASRVTTRTLCITTSTVLLADGLTMKHTTSS